LLRYDKEITVRFATPPVPFQLLRPTAEV